METIIDNQNNKLINTIELNYFNCNKDVILFLLIFIPSLIITILIIILNVYHEIYKTYGICNPIFYFLGDNNICSKFVEKIIVDKMSEITPKINIDKNNNHIDMDTFINRIEEQNPDFYDITNIYKDFKEMYIYPIYEIIKKNYLAIIEFIYSLNELIVLILFKICNILIF